MTETTTTTAAAPAAQTLTVHVPVTGGVILGEAYYTPWLAEDLAVGIAAIVNAWKGQPVFTDEDDAKAWVKHIEGVNPRLGPWTVEERQARLVTYTDETTRLFLQ